MEKDIGRIKKNDNTEIVIRIDDFGGKTGVTIREYTTSDRYTGFTKSGTRISADSFKEFKKIINSIDESEFLKESEPTKKEKEIKKETKKDKKQTTLEDTNNESEEIEEEVY